tara:strand:+ start:11755 stop:12381 length:627 start_codon:yes stop_codon:yes gene_type:complete
MTGTQIQAQFNNYTDNANELSDADVLILMNKIYHQILDDRPWEILKKEYSGTTSTSLDYVALPADFKMLVPNEVNYTEPITVVYIGTDKDEFRVIPFSQRRKYRDIDNFCYVDHRQDRLVFTKQPTQARSIEYDYIYIPDDITASTSPVFRDTFHQAIVHGMALDHDIIEANEKALNYQQENNREYNKILSRMAIEDVSIKNPNNSYA